MEEHEKTGKRKDEEIGKLGRNLGALEVRLREWEGEKALTERRRNEG